MLRHGRPLCYIAINRYNFKLAYTVYHATHRTLPQGPSVLIVVYSTAAQHLKFDDRHIIIPHPPPTYLGPVI